jgi:tetratricopeptide (TPR) repeat protein
MMHDRVLVHPYRSPDGAYDALLRFAHTAAAVLDPSRTPSTSLFSRVSDAEDYEYERTTTRYGDDTTGFEVIHRVEAVELGAASVSADIVHVAAYGLTAGIELRLESVRAANHPSFLRTLRVDVAGNPEAVGRVVAACRASFTPAGLTGDELAVTLRVARGYLRYPMWESAIEHAEIVLRHRPGDMGATMVLGIAWAALGRPEDAGRALEAVTVHDPTNVDAWYNAGCLHLAGGRAAAALDCFDRAQAVDGENHPVHYMRGCALEQLKRTPEALAAYRRAIATSPNPGQAFHYGGLDFTVASEQAIERLRLAG